MGELALTDNVPQEQPEASGRGADCWGTCEELLLVSAVRRHGTSNWNLIASELKDRAISLSVCPVYFSEEACKQKYDSLRGRYGSSNNMHWFEELRKLRVAHLKRELELYDGSIGSLQVKIKRLKAEKAQDMLLSKQAGITVAKAQSNDSLLVTMSHEIHVSSSPSDEGSVMDDMVHSSKTPSSLPLEKPMVPENGEVDEQGPNLLPAPSPEQVTCEDQQVQDSAEEVKGTSPIVADMAVGVDDSSQQSGEIQNFEVETTEQPSVLGTSTDESKPDAELHYVAHSVPQEGENAFVSSIAELDSKQKDGLLEELVEPAVGGYEAARTEFCSADEDTEMLQSEDDHRYDLLIRRHMDLTTVRGRLEEGVYSGSREFFRDLLLIFNNALVYYPSESSQFSAAKALRAEATREMERIFRMEALLNQDGPATGTRESKKPKSGEGGAVPIVSGSPALVGGSVTGVLATAVAPSLDKASRKRSGSRAPIAVETSCSETLVDSEAAGARSGSANVVNAPSSGRAGETAESQEDEEVNGRFKDTKSLHKGGSGRGKVPREELLEGILSKNASNKGLGRVKLRGMKVDDSKKSGAPNRAVGSKIKEEREDTEKKKGKERDEIGDNDLLRKGKSVTKLKDRDVMREREGESKAVPTRKAPSAPRPPSNSHDTISQTVVRPARGVRKPVNSTKEPARVPEQQPKKRARK
ncbi:unnamed protein product [Sphagnum troendelagicum]|uniref:Bromo domain-containing protein n=1 Tax=Sphagnum troendelagicum TaxID=128251 RepID=A0ABP0UHU0_9BRYO